MSININEFSNQKNFTDEQLKAFKDINIKIEKTFSQNDNSMFLLSGAAGTGKTYLLTSFIEHLSLSHSIAVTAPTHKALSVIESNFSKQVSSSVEFKTIHSFLNIKLKLDNTTGEESYVVDSYRNYIKYDVLIIDESSMISEDLFTHIQNAFEKRIVQVILFVGDPFQLLPIDNNKNVIFTAIKQQYILTKIVRQAKDSYIIDIATQARKIIEEKKEVDILDFFYTNKNIGIEYFYTTDSFHNDFCKNPQWENENKIITCFTNNNVNMHNDTLRNRYWIEQGKDTHEYFFLGERLILQEGYKTNKGEILINNKELILTYAKKEFFANIGIDLWVCKDKQQNDIFIVDPQSQVKYQKFLDDTVAKIRLMPALNKREMWNKFFKLKYTFALVKPPYSSTIHKLQGSTIETVYLDITDLYTAKKFSFEVLYRLIYVALTRASKNIKILLPISSHEELKSIQEDLNATISSVEAILE